MTLKTLVTGVAAAAVVAAAAAGVTSVASPAIVRRRQPVAAGTLQGVVDRIVAPGVQALGSLACLPAGAPRGRHRRSGRPIGVARERRPTASCRCRSPWPNIDQTGEPADATAHDRRCRKTEPSQFVTGPAPAGRCPSITSVERCRLVAVDPINLRRSPDASSTIGGGASGRAARSDERVRAGPTPVPLTLCPRPSPRPRDPWRHFRHRPALTDVMGRLADPAIPGPDKVGLVQTGHPRRRCGTGHVRKRHCTTAGTRR